MADVVPDEVVAEVAVEAPIERLGEAVRDRYDGLLDRVGFYALEGATPPVGDDSWAQVVAAARR